MGTGRGRHLAGPRWHGAVPQLDSAWGSEPRPAEPSRAGHADVPCGRGDRTHPVDRHERSPAVRLRLPGDSGREPRRAGRDRGGATRRRRHRAQHRRRQHADLHRRRRTAAPEADRCRDYVQRLAHLEWAVRVRLQPVCRRSARRPPRSAESKFRADVTSSGMRTRSTTTALRFRPGRSSAGAPSRRTTPFRRWRTTARPAPA